MTSTENQIVDLLKRKEGIEQFTDNHRWLLEAVELLLRHQLELREELRNAGILR